VPAFARQTLVVPADPFGVADLSLEGGPTWCRPAQRLV
jgi:hypothetical protein